jgi:hypothetical protein
MSTTSIITDGIGINNEAKNHNPMNGKGEIMFTHHTQGMEIPIMVASCARAGLYPHEPAENEPPFALRHTLFEHLFGAGELALVKAEKRPPGMSYRSWTASLYRKVAAWHSVELPDGSIRKMTALGASSSLKEYRYYIGTKEVKDALSEVFVTAQDATAYFGILTSINEFGIYDIDCRVRVVNDGEMGTGDGMGLVSRELSSDLLGRARKFKPSSWLSSNKGLRQMQVRIVGDIAGKMILSKGTLLPAALPDAIDLVLPKSFFKGRNEPERGYYKSTELSIGIREVARMLKFGSSYTFGQFFSQETHEKLHPQLEDDLAKLAAMRVDPVKVQEYLGVLPGYESHGDGARENEARSRFEEFLQAGLSPLHPWMYSRLQDMQRTAYVQLALGGGIKLHGAMTAFADLQDFTVCMPEEPEGYLVLSRYPVRHRKGIWRVFNDPKAIKSVCSGSVYMNAALAVLLDADFDGDYAIYSVQQALIDEVATESWHDIPEFEPRVKQRRSSPMKKLPLVLLGGMHNNVGTITVSMATAVLNGDDDTVPFCAMALQEDVQGLKWDVNPYEYMGRIYEYMKSRPIPEFLTLHKKDRDLFSKHTEVELPDIKSPIIDNYRIVIDGFVKEPEYVPEDFEWICVIPEMAIPPEVRINAEEAMRWYNNGISAAIEATENDQYQREQLIHQVILQVTAWSETVPVELRRVYAAAIWEASHMPTNVENHTKIVGTHSVCFHAFPEETAALIAEGCDRNRANLSPRKEINREGDSLHDMKLFKVRGFSQSVNQEEYLAKVQGTRLQLSTQGSGNILSLHHGDVMLGLPEEELREYLATLTQITGYLQASGHDIAVMIEAGNL